ncbi:MMPL family transporter [Anaerosalibacter bizertensis]|uniref:MMPL family transporter n=1 Tax=Anaerosalibacter bizertensis TaxID=932217 RepID=A0A9Q4FMD1_9FIRM|nr:MMPL family transporter [Anaerosalibacter bizertensis]MBV1818596.1 MMPL family transporter [Bacteroidales bacterium MSK.15.36]MCB5559629.1 MMPL family transporter [Anaerosalibacter bizertensis]MCG4565584.1 MMPL family transporter [Anaerosalibacter bizertensis]MCG4582207.1 MMPL family transporter [Anaerosalibacter bizertensis]MCG4583958.1 MMPL family transporter [Anaerosalibacter bizertensis]
MNKFGHFIAKHRKLVLLIATFLLLPSFYGMIKTKINYDILTYLPKKLESVKGQEILNDVFENSSTSFLVIENMEEKDVAKIKDKISGIEGVEKIIWVDDFVDTAIPKEALPEELKDTFYRENSTLLMIQFGNESSSDITQDAITEIRGVLNKQCFLSGMAAVLKDTVELADKQTPIYVGLAIALAVLVLSLTLESTIVPFIILISIGYAIMYNFGTNIIFGEISYITKSLAAVLQLGVTMDYSIFLLHRFEEESRKIDDKNQAMANAIEKTAASIMGSSLTTIAGFLAIAFMELTIGKDIGFVMAKGVFLGVVSVLTVLPALMLVFDKAIHRFSHKTLLPEFNGLSKLVTKHYKLFIILALLIFLPAFYGERNNEVYYNLDESLPRDMDSIVGFSKLKNEYNMMTTHMILVPSDTPGYKIKSMVDDIEKLEGIEKVISYDKFVGPGIPENFIPKEVKDKFEQGGYKLILVNSSFKAATDEENAQVDAIYDITKKYDSRTMVTGEGVLTKDLVSIADEDFKRVNVISILAVFCIILLVFTSVSIPLLLVLVIELAIFINMAVPYYMNNSIPFISSIVIGSIQLGATVDYAILLTTRFREEIRNGHNKFEAMEISVRESSKSIFTSGLTFFGSTVGVAIISDMEIVKSLSGMIARGALISTGVILFILPGVLLASEGFIRKTSKNWGKGTVDKAEKGRIIYENK